MPQQGPATTPMPSITRTEADRRKAILGLLQNALVARSISSVLAGRRTLVLRSDEDRERLGGPWEPARPADPQLYVFADGDVHIVTTNGEFYWFTSGRAHPAADPSGAARTYARRRAQQQPG
jgi:hypothetical protein